MVQSRYEGRLAGAIVDLSTQPDNHEFQHWLVQLFQGGVTETIQSSLKLIVPHASNQPRTPVLEGAVYLCLAVSTPGIMVLRRGSGGKLGTKHATSQCQKDTGVQGLEKIFTRTDPRPSFRDIDIFHVGNAVFLQGLLCWSVTSSPSAFPALTNSTTRRNMRRKISSPNAP